VLSGRIPDQIIDAAQARSVQANAAKEVLFGWIIRWIIQRDPPEYPGKYVARFATTHLTLYVMKADTCRVAGDVAAGSGAVTSPTGRSGRCGGDVVRRIGFRGIPPYRLGFGDWVCFCA
jgi:hypothetical protein